MADEADDDEDSGAPAPAEPGSPPAPAPAPGGAPAPAPVGGGGNPTTLPAPSLDSMVATPQQMEKTRQQLLAIQKAKMASQEADQAEVTSRLDRDRARMEQAYKASAVEPAGLEPWDANKKSAEHYTDPIQAFGSVGSVFAMLASSFAGLPMEAGLNAGAAAINAIHQGDEKAYNREFESWKANTDLAIKRHEMQRQAYNDSINLMNSNLNAGRTKMEMAATKFGDQKVQALLENGMDKELTDLFVARNKAAGEMQDQWDKIQLQHDKVTDLRSDPRYTSGNPELKNQAITEWTQRWAPNSSQKLRYDAKADYIASQKRANPNWTPDDMLKWNTDFANSEEGGEADGMKGNTPDKLLLNKFKEEHADDNNGTGPTADELAAFMQKLHQKSGSGKLTGPQYDQQQIAAREKAIAEKNPGMDALAVNKEAIRQWNADKAHPTAHDTMVNQKTADMIDNTLSVVDKQLDRLEKYVGISGTPGYLSRGAEKVGNVFGSNSVERQEFAKDVELMRLNAPRLLTMSQGRPLASEAARINTIIKGTSFGDLNAPTIAAMRDYKALLEKMKADTNTYINNTWKPGGSNPEGIGAGSTAPTKPAITGKMPWQKDPIIAPGSRSDAGGSFNMAGDVIPLPPKPGDEFLSLANEAARLRNSIPGTPPPPQNGPRRVTDGDRYG